MSGLIGFFKDFLPNVQNIDYHRVWEELTEDEKKGAVPPTPSPTPTPTPTPSPLQTSKRNEKPEDSMDTDDDDDNDDTKNSTDNANGKNNSPALLWAAALSKPPPRQWVEFTPEPLSFKEFRRLNRESLKMYFVRRLISEEEEEEEEQEEAQEREAAKTKNGDDESDDDNDDDDDDDEYWESDGEEQKEDETEGLESSSQLQSQEQPQQQTEDDDDDEMMLQSQPAAPTPVDESSNDDPSAPTTAANSRSKRRQKRRRRRVTRIPPLYQAIHSIQTLDYLDLRTKDLSLNLCRVTKVWRLRQTRRGVHYLRPPTEQGGDATGGGRDSFKQRCCIFPGRMPRVVFGHLEDDGPLSCAYDYVLSLEVEQLVANPNNNPANRNQEDERPQRRRSIRIFLYNAYAKAVSEWMEEQSIITNVAPAAAAAAAAAARRNKNGPPPRNNGSNSNSRSSSSNHYILSLSQIPALSIFPRALDPRDWWDQEHMLPYCICLGDSSSMATTCSTASGAAAAAAGDGTNTTRTTTRLRADSPDMEVRLMVMASATAIEEDSSSLPCSSELVVSQNMLLGPDEEIMEENTSPSNHKLWNTWKEYCQAQNPNPTTTTTTFPEEPTTPATAAASEEPQTQPQPQPQQQAQAIQPGTTQAPTRPSTTTAAPVMPNFSTSAPAATPAAASTTGEPPPAVPVEIPSVRVPPNRPPPPPLVERPVEAMAFMGTARRRSRNISDVTNTMPNHSRTTASPAAAASSNNNYVPLASLKALYESSQCAAAAGGTNNNNNNRGINNNRFLTIDVYAVVLGFTAPSQTKRGDWMIDVTLVDETCTIPMTLVMFTKFIAELPRFQRMGDVLRMHRVSLSTWNGEAQLTGRKSSSYVVIRREDDEATTTATATATTSTAAKWTVVPTATKEYSFEGFDEKRSQSLWHWGQRLVKEQPTMLHMDHKFTLGEMAQVTDQNDEQRIRDRDLTVMVTAKIPYPPEDRTSVSACGFVRVWDGTGGGQVGGAPAPPYSDPLPIDTLAAQESQRDGDPPPASLTKLATIIEMLNNDGPAAAVAAATTTTTTTGPETTTSSSQTEPQSPNATTTTGSNNNNSTETASRMPRLEIPEAVCGTVANAIIWEPAHWDLLYNHVPVGTFIRLRNVDVRHYRTQSFRSLMVHSKSWLSPLPDQTYEIRTLLQEHNQRMLRKEFNPSSGLLPLAAEQQHAVAAARPSSRDPPAAPHRDERAAEPTAANGATAAANLRLGNGLAAFVSSKPSGSSQQGGPPKKKRKKQSDNTTLVYKGRVQLLEPTFPTFNGDLVVYCRKAAPTPTYRFVVTVADASDTSLRAIVDHAVAEKLLGVTAAVAVKGGHCQEAPFDSSAAWNATIRCMLKQGKKFFILTDIEKAPSAI